MSLQHIVDAANQLAQEGKKPSIALIKSRLTQPASMRDIIETLKNWRVTPHTTGMINNAQQTNDVPATADTDATVQLINTAVASLRQEIAPLHQEIAALKAEMAALKLAILKQ